MHHIYIGAGDEMSAVGGLSLGDEVEVAISGWSWILAEVVAVGPTGFSAMPIGLIEFPGGGHIVQIPYEGMGVLWR